MSNSPLEVENHVMDCIILESINKLTYWILQCYYYY